MATQAWMAKMRQASRSSRFSGDQPLPALRQTAGLLRKFKLCRICFRSLALEGMLPGVTKSSW